MKKAIRIIVFLMLSAMMLTVVSSAATAYSTYTYSSDKFVLESPDAYVPETIVDSAYASASFTNPADIVTDKDGNVYIVNCLENGASVIILDPYYHYKAEISSFVNEQGVTDTFMNPSGVYVTDNYIYVCDTDNARIVMFERGGSYRFVKTVAQPVSNYFEDDAIYKPVAVAVDAYGRLFIVSSTTYQGIIVMSDDGDFYGFIGSQKVAASGGISGILKLLGVKSESQDENISKEYNNITIDSENFIYATINTIDESLQQAAIEGKDGTYAPVKKFNASGLDVMRRNGFFAPSGEVIVSTNADSEITGASSITDVAVGPEGTWSIADKKRSKIFTYDAEGNLLFAFGDCEGSQKGNILSIAGFCYHGDRLLILDGGSASFTVFRRTEYGDILINAIKNQNLRNYDSAVEDWKEILKRNNNFDIAYIGIGKALARDGEYEKAMEYFKYSHEREGRYSEAFKQVRKKWASKHFIIIPIVVAAFIAGIALFFGYAGKVNKRATLKVGTKSIGEEILYAFHVLFHPFDGFYDLKHEKRGSIRSAFIILLIVIATFAYQSLGTSYVFDQKTSGYSSIYSTIISVIVPVMLWVISNWCLTTLFDGEGTFGDIFVATCYSLIPIPLFFIPSVLLSNVLVADEKGIMTTLTTIAWIWVAMLLYVGMMTTHGYTFFKNLLTVILTIVGMVIIMFLAILFFELMAKLFNLFTQLWVEISFRT